MKITGHFRAEYLKPIFSQLQAQNIDYRDSEFYSPLFDTAYVDQAARLPTEIVLFWLQDLFDNQGFSISAMTWLELDQIYPINELEQACRTLQDALSLYRQMLNSVASEGVLDIHFSSNGIVEFEFYRNPVIDTPIPSFAAGQWLVFSLLMRTIALYSDAKPACVSFVGKPYFGKDINQLFSGCPVLVEQNKIALYYRSEDLDLPESFFRGLNPHKPCVWELRQFIHEVAPTHFAAKRFSGEALAHALGISSRHLNRRLAEEGLSLRDMIAELKVSEAKTLLKDTDESIAVIAKKLGYSTNSHFIRAFKNYTGITPNVYRQHKRF